VPVEVCTTLVEWLELLTTLQVSSIKSKGNLVKQHTLASLAWFEWLGPMHTIGFPAATGAVI